MKISVLIFGLYCCEVIILLFGADGFIYCQSRFQFPPPSGQFNIGTTFQEFVDYSRKDLFKIDQKPRKVYVKIWYPSDISHGDPENYLPEPESSLQIVEGLFQLPVGYFGLLKNVRTNAIRDVPIAKREAPFPLIIYQHGYSFWVNQNTVLMEHLASHGFVVVGIVHPYESCYAISDQNELIVYPYSNKELQKRFDEILNSNVSQLIDQIITTEDTTRVLSLERELISLTPSLQHSVKLWAKDVSYVIDELDRINQSGDHFLSNKLDLDKIGAIGMSFGGGATAQLIIDDDRIKAGVNLDGGLQGDVLDIPLDKPFLQVISSNHGFLNNIHFLQSTSDAYHLTVKGAMHLDFCDLNLISPSYFQQIGLMGNIDKARINTLINQLCSSFMKKYLTMELDLFDLGYPEITVKKRIFKY